MGLCVCVCVCAMTTLDDVIPAFKNSVYNKMGEKKYGERIGFDDQNSSASGLLTRFREIYERMKLFSSALFEGTWKIKKEGEKRLLKVAWEGGGEVRRSERSSLLMVSETSYIFGGGGGICSGTGLEFLEVG